MDWPYPSGTYVVAETHNGIPLRAGCRGHIWELRSDPMPVDYGCGYIQCAVCLVCGGAPTAPLDADFFWHKADAGDVAGCLGEIAEAVDWLGQVKVQLEAWWANGGQTPKVTMRNFG